MGEREAPAWVGKYTHTLKCKVLQHHLLFPPSPNLSPDLGGHTIHPPLWGVGFFYGTPLFNAKNCL